MFVACPSVLLLAQLPAPPDAGMKMVHYDGAPWHIKGSGVVCCPCKTPCPCRTNGQPSYAHCEATMYLRIREGQYGSVNLSGMQVVDAGGMCAVSYHQRAALYFDRSSTPAQQAAYMKMVASFFPEQETGFLNVRTVAMQTQAVGDRLFNVTIPGLLEMSVDRNWGQPSPPMPVVAASDNFSNTIQYAQNKTYRINDDAAGIHFDYSRRQANYRSVDLDNQQYQDHSMLIQFVDGAGSFNEHQLELIRAQKLTLPDLEEIRNRALRLRNPGSHE